MKLRKMILLLSVFTLLVFFSSSVFAASSNTGVMYSTDSTKNQAIYYANNWSILRNWDLRNNPNIPSNAVVTGVALYHTMFPTTGFSGLNMALYKEDGTGYMIPYTDTIYDCFDGEPVKQLWSSRFYVTQWNSPGNPLWRTPLLVIYYEY